MGTGAELGDKPHESRERLRDQGVAPSNWPVPAPSGGDEAQGKAKERPESPPLLFPEDPDPFPQAVEPGCGSQDKGPQSVGHPTNLLERAQPGKRLFPGALRTSAEFLHHTG